MVNFFGTIFFGRFFKPIFFWPILFWPIFLWPIFLGRFFCDQFFLWPIFLWPIFFGQFFCDQFFLWPIYFCDQFFCDQFFLGRFFCDWKLHWKWNWKKRILEPPTGSGTGSDTRKKFLGPPTGNFFVGDPSTGSDTGHPPDRLVGHLVAKIWTTGTPPPPQADHWDKLRLRAVKIPATKFYLQWGLNCEPFWSDALWSNLTRYLHVILRV